MSLLSLKGVGHSFGERAVLDGVDLEVSSGEVVALIGPNGAGKSTLLSVIAGDLAPQRGEALVGGLPPQQWKPLQLARRRGVLLQSSSVRFSYAVSDVVAMGRTPWRKTERADDDARVVAEAMRTTDITHLSRRDVMTLSGGENGRTQLSRVLAQETPLVLLDEPTAALDILHQETTLKTCRGLAEQGRAVVVVLHDLDVAAAYADRVVLLHGGKVLAEGTPEQVCTAERLSEVYRWPIEVIRHPVSGRLMVLPQR